MSTGLQLAIEEILKEVSAKEAELLPLKIAANTLARKVPQPEPFPDLDGFSPTFPGGKSASRLTWRIDQFYGRSLAGSVVEIMTSRKQAGMEGPCTIDELHEDLKSGGFKFTGSSGNDENTKRGIKIALTKNTAQFVKIGDDTYGLKAWYGSGHRAKPKRLIKSGLTGTSEELPIDADSLTESEINELLGLDDEDREPPDGDRPYDSEPPEPDEDEF